MAVNTQMPTRRSKVRGIDKYLSPKKSMCRNEKKAGDYIVHSDAALDVKLLMALMKKKESSHLRGLVYVPKWILYAHDPRATQPFPNLSRAGLIISRLGSQFPVLSAPSTLCFEIERCRHLKKRFLVANMGIYVREYDSEDGHSNSIIIDVKNKVVERFDPHGRGGTEAEDLKIEKLFKKKLPDYEYVGTRKSSPEQGVQSVADSFGGMCATYAAMFSLLRITNPNESSATIQTYMKQGSPAQLRERVLRFHRYIADTLRGERLGSTLHI